MKLSLYYKSLLRTKSSKALFTSSNVGHLYDDLRYGRVDIIFINSTIIVNENKYNSFKLLDIEDCFFTNPESYQKLKKVTNLKQILSENLIVQNERYDTRPCLESICIKIIFNLSLRLSLINTI